MIALTADMSGQELADLLTDIANRVQQGVEQNRAIVEQLRELTASLEAKRKGDNA